MGDASDEELLEAVAAARPHAAHAPSVELAGRVRGCLLLGAVGDALGAPVEFSPLARIRAVHGRDGVRGYAGRAGRITDDTQMTLFTAEGILRGLQRRREGGAVALSGAVQRAYLRWLLTQGESADARPDAASLRSGWLVDQPELHRRAAPGNTCLSALRAGGNGTVEHPLNGSKGCGGVMRVAPAGFLRRDPFATGVAFAALTHGHPSGYLAAGVLAAVVAEVVLDGAALVDALRSVLRRLREEAGHEEVLTALRGALAAAADGPVDAEALERLGEGWVADEALAMALWCVLVEPDPARTLPLAVTHSGDSDSTGAIAGNLLGALRGADVVPAAWLDDLVERDVVTRVAEDLVAVVVHGRAPDPLRYPGDEQAGPLAAALLE